MAVLLAPGEGRYSQPASPAQHVEYPKHMVHPGYQPGTIGQEVKSPHGFSYYIGGTAIRFPPVLVMNADQEEMHAAQGYVSIGKSDPAAFARAAAAAVPVDPDHVPEPYPKWVAGRVVNSAAEEAVALGQPAPEPPVEVVPEKPAPELENARLRAELAEMRALLESATAPPVVEPADPAESGPRTIDDLLAADPATLTHGEKVRLGRHRAKAE